MIPLDIFREKMHNKDIETELEAWLTFLSNDEPEVIIQLITQYPKFKAMYETLYQMCRNVEGVMNMFSEELRQLDRNTVKYMIEEQQKEIEEYKEQLTQKDEQLTQQGEQLMQKDEQLTQKDKQLTQQSEQLLQKDEQIAQLKKQLEEITLHSAQ